MTEPADRPDCVQVTEGNPLLALRRALQRLTYSHHPRDHVRLVEALRSKFKHEVRLVEPADHARPFTCVMHALDIAEPPPIIVDLAKREDCYPHPEFVSFLIRRRVLKEIVRSAGSNGDVAVYSARETVKHVGLVDEDRILSKWGSGHLWRHPLLEVPSSYGSSIRRYRRVTREGVVPEFLAYARTKIGDARVERSLRRVELLRGTYPVP